MLFIRICSLNSYVNLNQNQSCQLQISSANNKCLLSCQFQSSTVLSTFLSNSSSCSYVNQIQFLFKCNLFLLTAKWLVRIQEQLVPANSLCYRSSSKFTSKNSLCLPIHPCYRSSSKFTSKNSLYLSFWYPPSNQFKFKNSSCFLFCFLSAK